MTKKWGENSKRWTDADENIYFCTICQKYHYKNSGIGKRHLKFKEKGGE